MGGFLLLVGNKSTIVGKLGGWFEWSLPFAAESNWVHLLFALTLQQISTFLLFTWLTINCVSRSSEEEDLQLKTGSAEQREEKFEKTAEKKKMSSVLLKGNKSGETLQSKQQSISKASAAAKVSTEDKTQFDDDADKTQIDEADKYNVQPAVKVSAEKWIPYPVVKELTKSEKKRKAELLEKDKQKKIAEGFYQPRSDLDDTLDQVKSLDMERSEARFSWLRGIRVFITVLWLLNRWNRAKLNKLFYDLFARMMI
ncbi:unnamed protein product [Strongylus vulgaris]|uniref:Uncharacterized protein n=1 Tax=Strongylus vulgaris TaxID=40348 RepID=A0A3P7IIN8_STRVU|nr:unnamed protein product [Strongylus vulgaris]